ncbi:hypothetical protein [Mastigocoleus sp. MO_188.B34]|uniref:hypothetical protein n=1 Tax=Mastigocoleus sp. MO_188.B34 TaxID=3036635 RepID=UPI002615D6B2|nr:hypothetical protein [Mastigocoleus sp. MO_188.B34]MDJ0696379.1 hypothetical protein [Mastigocoleus sp. MO_188.B34]
MFAAFSFPAGILKSTTKDNPVALRLKELEVLERISEKIEKIQVNGSLDSILTELIQINRD